MECKLGTTILTELHNYNTMAYFVLLTFDTKNDSHIEEVTETNSLSRESISKCRWAKAPKRRNPNQTVGHMIITFMDPDSTNNSSQVQAKTNQMPQMPGP